jgi:carbon-monoxide dehydrogenase small subunit
MFAVQAHGHTVTTIEGIATGGVLSPRQSALYAEYGLQWGFCTSGLVTSAFALIQEGGDLTDERLREGLSGNLCPCTGYKGVLRAVARIARGSAREDQ